jgi:hypothetical protein
VVEEYVVTGGFVARGIFNEIPQWVEPAMAAVLNAVMARRAPTARRERYRVFMALV